MVFDIQDLLAQERGEVSVLCWELSAPEPLYSLEAERRMCSASIIKVPILLTLLEQIRRGVLQLDDVLLEKASLMITLSDNESTNDLIALLGFEAVNDICKTLGLRQTIHQRKMLDFISAKAGRDNYTSAMDMFLLYQQLFNECILNPALCRLAIEILEKQRHNLGIPRYISGVKIAHKTGGLDYLSHDAGVISFNGKRLYVGVFIQNADDVNGNQKLIAQIAKRAYCFANT